VKEREEGNVFRGESVKAVNIPAKISCFWTLRNDSADLWLIHRIAVSSSKGF